MALECKWSQTAVDRNLRCWKARFPKCDALQVSATGTKDFVTPDGIRVCDAFDLLGSLV